MEYNTLHFKQVLTSPVYSNKNFPRLTCPETQKQILTGTLTLYECDNQNVYEFLSLLKTDIDVLFSSF